MTALETKSKFLSYILRHKPEAAGIALSKEGWVSVEDVCRNTDITFAELHEIVRADKKGRYSIENSLIRANQGHSTETVKLNYKTAVPPPALYHGTTASAAVRKDGLKPMSRHHVHMSADVHTAQSVGGRRRGTVTIFVINTAAMLKDGFKFYLSENNVWLIEHVPTKYLKEKTL